MNAIITKPKLHRKSDIQTQEVIETVAILLSLTQHIPLTFGEPNGGKGSIHQDGSLKGKMYRIGTKKLVVKELRRKEDGRRLRERKIVVLGERKSVKAMLTASY